MRRPFRRCLPMRVSFVVLALGAMSALQAQTAPPSRPADAGPQGSLSGIVRDNVSRVPVACLHVALEDSTGRVVDRAITEMDGSFTVFAPTVGTHQLRFEVVPDAPTYGDPTVITADGAVAYEFLIPFAGVVRGAIAHPQPATAPIDTTDSIPPRTMRNTSFPSFPREEISSGNAGSVTAAYTIDSAGRFVPGTEHIISSTRPTFSKAVVRWLPDARFHPAHVAGHAVCALVWQTWEFRVGEAFVPAESYGPMRHDPPPQ